MKDFASPLRWLVAYPLGLLAASLAATAVYFAVSLPRFMPGMHESPVINVLAVVAASALGAHVFVTVSGRVAPAAHIAAACAACAVVLLAAISWWYRLPRAAAWAIVAPLAFGALAGVLAIMNDERKRARRSAAEREGPAGSAPAPSPPQS